MMPETAALETVLKRHTAPADPQLVDTLPDEKVRCHACGHRCLIGPGRSGVCKVRYNEAGTLKVPHDYVAGLQCDPIEKKPFFHALPGTQALSYGMLGCDLHCSFCQNWVSSQVLRDPEAVASVSAVSPEQIVELARQYGASTLASTYNEPLITSDWSAEIFRLARPAGFHCAYVSNGNANARVLDFLRTWVDLYKIDLKCYNDHNYRRLGTPLKNVLDSIVQVKERGIWLEVLTLVVPGFNDDPSELKQIARFVASVSTDIPWHVTAYHDSYKSQGRGRTQAKSLIAAASCGREQGLKFVYAGNIPSHVGDFENTRCPSCSELLIERQGYWISVNRLSGSGKCPRCGTAVAGVWE